MTIYFITSNEKKFKEASNIIPNLEMLNLDLPEIQEIDAKKIIESKLKEAFKHHNGEFIVEDTSLYLEALGGFPGPLIKWMLQSIGNRGIFNLTDKLSNKDAIAKTIIGYAKNKEEVHYFEGSIKGNIIQPEVKNGFGWDPLFQPQGFNTSFAQLSIEDKNKISMRSIALRKLSSFLSSK
jgi:non-canonical purine NTP pyrophosphatase (RdgB/HAM1 family)